MKGNSKFAAAALLMAVAGTGLAACSDNDCRPHRGWGNASHHNGDRCRHDRDHDRDRDHYRGGY